jgi:hypothetical protein
MGFCVPESQIYHANVTIRLKVAEISLKEKGQKLEWLVVSG